MERVDAVVVGAGFGGLGAALELARAGARVVVFEALDYPGGCAGTFVRDGVRFEAGATLVCGLGPDQTFGRLLAGVPDLARDVDPERVLEVRTPTTTLAVPSTRAALVDRLCALPGAPVDGLRSFFAEQGRVAELGWRVFSAPELLPPWSAATLPAALRAAPSAPVLARVGLRTLDARLAAHGVGGFAPLRAWAEALCRITVQVPPAEAEATFAMSAVDYPFRGVRHLRGGPGALAAVLVDAIREAGGEVRFSERVRGLGAEGPVWRVRGRRGDLLADRVFANVAPHVLPAWAGVDTPRVRRLSAAVERGAAACAWFLQLRGSALPPDAFHLDLTADPAAPTVRGNHVLCSVSAADDDRGRGVRTAVVSTHLPDARAPASEVDRVHAVMRDTLSLLAPEVAGAVVEAWTASPRTWQRFTFRPGGWVGGVPRRRELSALSELVPRPVAPGLWLVGDAVMLGQSTLATFVSGSRTALAALR